jgi:hypothetical protein
MEAAVLIAVQVHNVIEQILPMIFQVMEQTELQTCWQGTVYAVQPYAYRSASSCCRDLIT